uniref:Uncharacterized protein n=1 Tax=Anguilla anguilla TaxID=7936 RepID=A0A0E9WDT6_ANGAN
MSLINQPNCLLQHSVMFLFYFSGISYSNFFVLCFHGLRLFFIYECERGTQFNFVLSFYSLIKG